MKARRIFALAAVALGMTTVVAASPAGASAPSTLTGNVHVFTVDATAYNYAATGPIHYAPHLFANCVGYPTASSKGLALNVPGIGTVYVPSAACGVSNVNQTAYGLQSITGASLLGGRITLGAVNSTCLSDAAGNVTVGSSVASINGHPIGSTPGSLVIPGVASIYYNLNTQSPANVANFFDPVSLQSIAVLIVVPAHTVYVLGRPVTTPAQTITIGEFSISGNSLDE